MTTPSQNDIEMMERGEFNATNTIQELESNQLTSWTSIRLRVCISSFQKLKKYFINQGIEQDDQEEPELPQPRSGLRRLEYYSTGYPLVATFLDSDENFMVFRRFGYLSFRLLLRKQDELRELEDQLDFWDKRDEAEDETILNSRERDEALKGPRLELLNTIETKFREYGELLCMAKKMIALDKPASMDYRSVKLWFTGKPIVVTESYMQHKKDIITLKPGRENTWLDGAVEKILRRLGYNLRLCIFRSKETCAKTSGQHAVYFTKRCINVLITLAMILTLLILPVYLLWHFSDQTQTHENNTITIVVPLIFTLIFSSVLSFFTKAQRHEILGAAAAYCAVLVVFTSNVGNNNG